MKILKSPGDRIVLINCTLTNDQLVAGYFYCDKRLSPGDYQLQNPIDGKTVVIQLPEQAVNLPGVGQQFNYPFQIVKEIEDK